MNGRVGCELSIIPQSNSALVASSHEQVIFEFKTQSSILLTTLDGKMTFEFMLVDYKYPF